MIDKNVLIPLFLAFAISVALSPFVIPFLRRLKVGQTEREEGVKSHLKKAGTPTMGGCDDLDQPVLVTSLFFMWKTTRRSSRCCFVTVGFGIDRISG